MNYRICKVQNQPAYTSMQSMQETQATLDMEGMKLTEDEVRMLTDYSDGRISGDNLRKMIFASVASADRGDCDKE